MREFYLASTGGGQLRCGVWMPVGQPRAVVQLVHGIAEHIGRYEELGAFLTDRGVAMVADDHMGHGKSVGHGQAMGFFPSGWLGAVEDEKRLCDRVREQLPGLPYVFLGHSMGSFLTRTFLYRYPDAGLTAVILSGTAWQPRTALRFGLALCRVEERWRGETGSSAALQKIAFGGYNRKFRPVRTPNDWICSDPAVVDGYNADPLCGFQPTVGLARDMLRGLWMNERPENLAAMDKSLPVYFFSGREDPVGSMGRGVLRSARAFRAAGLSDVTVRLYPGGRHEMLNEPNRCQVMEDLWAWLAPRLRQNP